MKIHPNSFLWASLGLLLLAFVLRYANMLVLPLFVDEATHIYYAQFQILEPNPFFGAENNKWLYLLALRLFRPLGPEAPWLARVISVLASLVTVSCAIAIGRLLDRPSTGLVAGLLYAVLPLAVWHERQGLADPLMAAMTALVTLLSLRLALRPRIWIASLLAVTLSGALIAKLNAVPFLVLPVVAAVLLLARSTHWRKALAYSAAASIAAVPVYLGYSQAATVFGHGSRDTHAASTDNLLVFDLGNLDARLTLTRNFTDYLDTMWVYVGPLLLLAVIGSLVWVLFDKRRWEILLLWIPALVFTVLPIVSVPVTGSGWTPPRYYLAQALPMALLAALTLTLLTGALPKRLRLIPMGFTVLILIFAMADNLTYISNPLNADLTRVDQDNYWAFSSGYGRIDAVQALLDEHEQEPNTRLNVIGRGYDMIWFRGYIGPDVGSFETLEQEGDEDEAAQQGRVARWLAEGDRVFYVEEVDRSPINDNPHGAELTLIGNYQYREREYRLYEAMAATPSLAERIFLILGRDPEFMQDDLQTVGSSFDTSEVWVFPPTHAETLSEFTQANTAVIPLATWPFTQEDAQAAIAELLNANDSNLVDVVISNPAETDPDRYLQAALAEGLYPLGETNFTGFLAHQRYVIADGETKAPSLDIVFEGVITLEAGGQVAVTEDGRIQLYAFDWQTEQPVEDSFIVFLHIINEQGELVAQRDGIPQNGLQPLTVWPVDQTIRDQFALELPSDLAAGRYQVRLGLYEPTSGLRLRITSNNTDSLDTALIGEFDVP